MNEMQVKTDVNNYEIILKENYKDFCYTIKNLKKQYSKLVIISDEVVMDIYSKTIKEVFEDCNMRVVIITFFSGEKNKNIDTVAKIYEQMIDSKVDRKSLIIGLGGGVVGDIAGFVAATYMRGIDFVLAPTTLLSQVDSSIGGKTGFNFAGNKNIIGSFYQPQLVYTNVNSLNTLSKRHFFNGMAEVIKHGLILDRDYFYYLKKNQTKIKSMDYDTMKYVVKRSCELKGQIVALDEKESGIRKILNFGHTLGHAVESLLEYELLHGECVSVGIAFCAYISMEIGSLKISEYDDIINLLKMYNLPTKVCGLSSDEIYEHMFLDKKTTFGRISIICLDGIGKSFVKDDLSDEQIIGGIKKILSSS